MNILVMAGTKDAVDIIKMLSKRNTDYKPAHIVSDNPTENISSDDKVSILATTTTSYGAELAKKAGAHEVISEALPKEDLVILILNKKIDLLIDATHPFAAQATINAIEACKNTSTNYIRYERSSAEYNIKGVHNVNSFEEAGKVAFEIVKNTEKNVLHLAGVSTINKILQNVLLEKLIVRVLPNIDSISKCRDMGIPGENIVAMQGVFSREFNQALMKEYKAGTIITKESGKTGGVPEKIEAALDLGLEVVLVNRPHIKELNDETVFNNLEELEKELNPLFY